MNGVNYREFDDFRKEIRDTIKDIQERIIEDEHDLERVSSEIKNVQIEQLEAQVRRKEKILFEDTYEDLEDQRHKKTLTIAIIAAILGPLIGATIGSLLTHYLG
jgi:hypothetical protein